MGNYAVWAQNWATGMQAAESKTAARREAAHAQMVANRKRGAERPCGIKGCKRHSFKGRLCRMHWRMIPYESKAELTIACMTASRAMADKYHRRFLRELQARL